MRLGILLVNRLGGGEGGTTIGITADSITLYTNSDKTTEVDESNLVYTGDVIEPTVVVKIGDTPLTAGSDYKVDYVKK